MTILSEEPVKQHPEAAIDAAERLERAIAADPVLAGATPLEILRLVPGRRAVFSGLLDDRDVVFRLFLDETSVASAENEWAELQRAYGYMSTGHHRVAEPVHHNPDHGLLVVGEVNGTPLLEQLWSLPPEERAALMRPSADWLRAFTRPTERWKTANRGPWRTWAEEAAAQQPHRRLQGIEGEILKKMKQLGRKFKGVEWRVAISHGDFHPNNLFVEGERITGIDLGGSTPMPIYKDIARFLVHMARRDMLPSGERHFGVCRGTFDAFTDAFEMTDIERSFCLPFMIAFETLVRVEHKRMPSTRIRLAKEMSEHMYVDLKAAASS